MRGYADCVGSAGCVIGCGYLLSEDEETEEAVQTRAQGRGWCGYFSAEGYIIIAYGLLLNDSFWPLPEL